ncbi:unnamed protein product [Soboliphyme baturini]|uniref:Uncharacterized protein n=1 Tax=Soboliphyme baturini TaxID=241478 RepID=A0A183JBB5_9BILA|nr:unnamed protein product [Soboliphyme baturini]
MVACHRAFKDTTTMCENTSDKISRAAEIDAMEPWHVDDELIHLPLFHRSPDAQLSASSSECVVDGDERTNSDYGHKAFNAGQQLPFIVDLARNNGHVQSQRFSHDTTPGVVGGLAAWADRGHSFGHTDEGSAQLTCCHKHEFTE